jgi:hypothetical protein
VPPEQAGRTGYPLTKASLILLKSFHFYTSSAMKSLASMLSLLAATTISASKSLTSHPESQTPYMDPDHFPDMKPDTSVRTQFGTVNCLVRGYPSSGGIVQGAFTGAELEWLGLSRSQPSSRSSDPHAEDEFSFQMLRLGAQWWRSECFYDQRSSQISGGYPWPENHPPTLDVGYPSTGGVWVLKTQSGDFEPEDFAKVIMAFTMDERCAALEKVGATFYPNVDDCPDIAKSLEDGIAIGKQWEERMKAIDG